MDSHAGAIESGTGFDVAIVGGAFAGAATALMLRRTSPDLRVLIVEAKSAFDKKVGESAIELSSWFLTQVLGLDRHLALEQLPKYGQRFWFNNDRVAGLADASELGNRYQTRVPSYHVDRSVLDEHVLDLAVAAGARLLRPARVMEAELREGDRSTLRVESPAGPLELTARWIIDATGRRAWLARKLGHLVPMPEHPTRAVWARYRGVKDLDASWLPGRADGRGVICSRGLSTNHLTGPGWWVWVIPLPGGEVSVGVVWDERIFGLPAGETIGQRFETFMRSFPAGRELMERAVRLDDDLHALNALPYRVRRVMGDGWAMVGDAAGFIDPFYSPGLDWGSLTVSRTSALVAKACRMADGRPARDDIERHNSEFTVGLARWFEALYLDKYYYLGDAELMEVALRLEVALYYFGVVTPAYRDGLRGAIVPFSQPVSLPFYHLMRFANRRLAKLGKIRMAAGSWGRGNAGRRVLLAGFKLGPSSLRKVPGALARLALLEAGSIPDRLAARRRASASPTSAQSPGAARATQP